LFITCWQLKRERPFLTPIVVSVLSSHHKKSCPWKRFSDSTFSNIKKISFSTMSTSFSTTSSTMSQFSPAPSPLTHYIILKLMENFTFFSRPSLPKTLWLRQWHLSRSTKIFKLPRTMPLHEILPMIFCLEKDQLILNTLVRICSSTICWSQNLSWCLDHFGENVFYHVCVHQNKHTILLTTVPNTK
jgi:hypothetical protein